MADAKLEIMKALIKASIPTLIVEFLRAKDKPKYDSLEEMQDCVDWDAEYRLLMKEEGYKPPKPQKPRKIKKKARK